MKNLAKIFLMLLLPAVIFAQIETKEIKDVGLVKISHTANKTESISIKGTIFDVVGALIPKAKFSIKNIKTKKEYFAEVNNDGKFGIPAIPAGKYIVIVEAKGFNDFKIDDLIIEKNQEIKFEFELQPSGVIIKRFYCG